MFSISTSISFLLTYKRRIAYALGWFLIPSVPGFLLYIAAVLLKQEVFASPPISDEKDYLTFLLAGTALFTALASIEAQIFFNLNEKVSALKEEDKAFAPAVRAREFTFLAAWLFSADVTILLLMIVVHVAGAGSIGAKTFAASQQYLLFFLFLLAWICLIAASLRKPIDK